MAGFTVPWSDAQQERLEDLVADIDSKPEDAKHLADAATTPADPQPVVREHDAAAGHHPDTPEERSGTAREAPGTLEGRAGAEPVVGAAPVGVGAQPAAPPSVTPTKVGAQGPRAPEPAALGPDLRRDDDGGTSVRPLKPCVAVRVPLPRPAHTMLKAMAAEAGVAMPVLAAELLTAVLEDDAAAHRDSEAA